MVLDISSKVPNPAEEADPVKRSGMERALEYMGLEAGTPLNEIPVDIVLSVLVPTAVSKTCAKPPLSPKAVKKADNVQRVLIVPGSGLVKEQAEKEGLHEVFIEAGFEWRERVALCASP